MSKQVAVRVSRLQYSHPSLELPPCFHRQHEPHNFCIHTSGCPYLLWHCQFHLVEARYGDSPSYLSRSSRSAGRVYIVQILRFHLFLRDMQDLSRVIAYKCFIAHLIISHTFRKRTGFFLQPRSC